MESLAERKSENEADEQRKDSDKPDVKPIFQPARVHKRVYRIKTPEQIFRLRLKLSQEIRKKSEEESV